MTAAARLLDQLCHFTAQSLESLELADHFQLVKLLGQGSYGEVSLALHRTRGTAMALKCFRRDSTCLLTFLREYNLSLAFCTHPSLTAALGIVFATPSHYVFAQQPCLFGDLYDVIVPEVGLEQRRAQGVASQVGGALSHLHSLGFVHRDVKPENVFLCDGDCRWVKLGDFGMVKAAGSRVPCVWYSSPYCTPEAEEARSGAGRVLVAVDPSADSWALGILIYAMLMGSLPWSETASDNAAYVSFLGWRKRECPASDGHQGAPQFSHFTPLSAALLRSLLHPLPGHRGRPEDVDRHLGGSWKLEKAVSG